MSWFKLNRMILNNINFLYTAVKNNTNPIGAIKGCKILPRLLSVMTILIRGYVLKFAHFVGNKVQEKNIRLVNEYHNNDQCHETDIFPVPVMKDDYKPYERHFADTL